MALLNLIPTRIYTLQLPDYFVNQKPNFDTVGGKLDKFIEAQFQPGLLALRGISLQDQLGFELDDLVAKILELGTDKYDPSRQGVLHDFYAPYRIDLLALPCKLLETTGLSSPNCKGSVMTDVISDFYYGPPLDRGGSPLRIDVLTVYDRRQLKPVKVDYGHDSDNEPCEFRFLGDKRTALLGVIKVL